MCVIVFPVPLLRNGFFFGFLNANIHCNGFFVFRYTEGDIIRENQTVTLVCVSRGGNPLASVNWFKNEKKLDTSYKSTELEAFNEYSFVASTKDNLARYRCEASNPISVAPKIADVVLTVHCKFFFVLSYLLEYDNL